MKKMLAPFSFPDPTERGRTKQRYDVIAVAIAGLSPQEGTLHVSAPWKWPPDDGPRITTLSAARRRETHRGMGVSPPAMRRAGVARQRFAQKEH